MKCTEIKCFLCDDVDGIIKSIDKQNDLWAHPICINWTPDIYYTDEKRINVEGTLNKERF